MLRDIDVSIPWASRVALVGPNAAGKTTLIRTWMGFHRPTSGRAYVAGRDATRVREAQKAGLAFIPQESPLYRDLTVRDHFDLAAHYRPEFDQEWAVERLIGIGIEPTDSVGRLSGGQQTQVCLTLALAIGAQILLLDEPLAHLDPLARVEFLDLLAADAARDGTTVVLSSHSIQDLDRYCDFLIVLGRGTVLCAGPIAELLASHRVTDRTPSELAGTAGVVFIGPLSAKADAGRLVLLTAEDGNISDATPTLEELVLGYLMSQRRPA